MNQCVPRASEEDVRRVLEKLRRVILERDRFAGNPEHPSAKRVLAIAASLQRILQNWTAIRQHEDSRTHTAIVMAAQNKLSDLARDQRVASQQHARVLSQVETEHSALAEVLGEVQDAMADVTDAQASVLALGTLDAHTATEPDIKLSAADEAALDALLA